MKIVEGMKIRATNKSGESGTYTVKTVGNPIITLIPFGEMLDRHRQEMYEMKRLNPYIRSIQERTLESFAITDVEAQWFDEREITVLWNPEAPATTLYAALILAGVAASDLQGHESDYAGHESDLYVPVTSVTTEIINAYREANKHNERSALYGVASVPTFKSNIEGEGLMYDIAFAYDPFWQQKAVEHRAMATSMAIGEVRRKAKDAGFNIDYCALIDPDHQHHFWYGGDVATVKKGDITLSVRAAGIIQATLLDRNGNEIATCKDKNNDGAFYDVMKNHFDDEGLDALLEGVIDDKADAHGRTLTESSRNWFEWEAFDTAKNKYVGPDALDNVFDPVKLLECLTPESLAEVFQIIEAYEADNAE